MTSFELHPPPRARRRFVVGLTTAVLAVAGAGLGATAADAGLDAEAERAAATITFGSTVEASGASARIGDSAAAPVVRNHAERECWELGAGSPHNFIYVTLDDALKHAGPNYAWVDIEYFDGPPATFTLAYDSTSDVWKQSTIITTTGTNTWQTARMFIADGGFTGRQNHGSDMRIATWSPGMGSSPGPVCIGGYTLEPSPVATQDVQVNVTAPANVFDSGATPTFGVLSASDDVVPWTVRDYDGQVLDHGAAQIDPVDRTGTVSTSALPDGYYTLSLEGHAADGSTVTRTAGFAVMKPPADPADAADSMFAVNAHPITAGQSFDWADATAAAARAGMGDVRVDTTYWTSVEKPKGSYTFSGTSQDIADQLVDQGQRGLYILGYGNPAYGGTPSTDEAHEAFGRYGAAVAAEFQDRIGSVEVWNEYYGGFSSGVCSQSAKCYAKMLAATYSKIKAVAPDVTVVGASSFKAPLDWFEEFFQLGGLDNLDVISIHPYRAPGTPDGLAHDVAALQELIRKYNDGEDKPIWITEQGWSTAPAEAIGVDEQTQAEAVARSLLEARSAGIAKYYWYDLINDGTDPGHSEHNFGLLRRTDAAADNLNPKPAYVAYATAARELTGAQYTGPVRTPDDGARGYRFTTDDGPLTALWSADRTERSVSVTTSRPIEVTDMLGRTATLSPVHGRVHLTLTGEPVYLHADVAGVEAASLLSVTAPEEAVAGDDIPVTVTLAPRTGPQTSMTVTVEGQQAQLTATPGRPAHAELTLPAGTITGTRTVRASADVDGRMVAQATTTTEVAAEQISADIAPVITGNGQQKTDALTITLGNRSARDEADLSAVSWRYGELSGSLEPQPALPAGERREITVPLDDQQPYRIDDAELTVELADGTLVTDSDAFSFAPVTHATPSLVNGDLAGLRGVPAIDLASVGNYRTLDADDVDADVWTTWDRQNLYVSAVAHEDRFHVANRPEWLPAGDSIAIGLQPGRPGGGLGSWGADWYMLYAGQTQDGGRVYAESLPRQYAAGMMPDAQVDVVRDENAKTTTYRIAIPWHRIPPLSPETAQFSLTVAVNKHDGVDRDNYRSLGLAGWQQWGDGVNNWRLAKYQQVQLTR